MGWAIRYWLPPGFEPRYAYPESAISIINNRVLLFYFQWLALTYARTEAMYLRYRKGSFFARIGSIRRAEFGYIFAG